MKKAKMAKLVNLNFVSIPEVLWNLFFLLNGIQHFELKSLEKVIYEHNVSQDIDYKGVRCLDTKETQKKCQPKENRIISMVKLSK